MRALLAPIALLATLSACATHSAPEGVPYRSDLPLRAQIQSSSMGVNGFYVNRPAYVALFEIVPGGGLSVLYPYYGSGSISSGFVYGGMKSLPLMSRETYGSYWRTSSAAIRSGPRYIYMIASEEPFNVDDFRSFQFRMGARFASYNAQSAMDDIARMLVPDVRRTNWTSDMYVYWPNVLYDRRMNDDNYVLITCNGRPYYVHPANVARVLRTVCSTDENVPPVRVDSTDVVDGEPGVPTRLRPTPATERPRTIWADAIQGNDGMRPERPRPTPRATPSATPEPQPRRAEPRTPRAVPERMKPLAPRPQPTRMEPAAPRPTPRAMPTQPVKRPQSRAIPVSRPRPDPVKPPTPPKKKGGGGGGNIR